MSRRPVRAAAAALLAAVLAGCGLPLQDGVRSPGPVAGDAQAPGGSQVLPPGPQPDAGPRSIVQGFLDAQANPDDDHAKAREFLHPDVRDAWSDDRVLVRSPGAEITVAPGDETRVTVGTTVVAGIADDGSFALLSERREESYRLRPDDAGQLRLAEVPDGLRLVAEDVATSFRPYDVLFLRGSGTAERAQLVPDRVFVPVGSDPADTLVRRLLAGPSAALTDAVRSAVPPGAALRSPVTTADGVVTVDLSGQARLATPTERRELSAQLVWTLRGAGQVFTALRLLVDGEPLDVDGAGEPQDRDEWTEYDPTRPVEGGALLVRDGRVAALSGGAPAGAGDSGLLAELVAVSPDDGTLALLTDSGSVVRTGPPGGPFSAFLTDGPVASLSWGSGEQGLWVVRGGPEPEVVLVPAAPAAAAAVPYVRPADAGPLTALRVSRDGARVAGVFGTGAGRQVFVGRVERASEGAGGPGGVRLIGFRAVAPGLTDVADVGWESGTSLVVLGALGTANRLPVRVAVDGSSIEPVRSLGLDGEPQALTTAPGRALVVGTLLADRQVLFVEEDGLFRGPVPGSAPAYAG